MSDTDIVTRLIEADAYNAKHYEPDPLHKAARVEIERLRSLNAELVGALNAAPRPPKGADEFPGWGIGYMDWFFRVRHGAVVADVLACAVRATKESDRG